VGIQRKRVNWWLDADIRGFFDNMNHEWTMKFVEHRVADRRVLRLIQKWLKAGVSEDGQWSETKLVRHKEPLRHHARQRVPALRVRSMGRSLAQESSEGDVIVVRYAEILWWAFNTGQTPSGSYGNFGSGWPSSVWN